MDGNGVHPGGSAPGLGTACGANSNVGLHNPNCVGGSTPTGNGGGTAGNGGAGGIGG